MKKFFTVLIVVVLLFSTFVPAWVAFGEPGEQTVESSDLPTFLGETTEKIYAETFAAAQEAPIASEDLRLVFDKKEIASGEELVFSLAVPETAKYSLKITYQSLKVQDAAFCLLIDGEIPFAEAGNILFPSFWRNEENAPRTDEKGSQYAPDQVLYEKVVTRAALDTLGRYEHPYTFLLSSGTHRIEMKMLQGAIRLEAITFSVPEQPEQYTEPQKSGVTNTTIIIEGEWADIKSDSALIPLSEGANVNVSPHDAKI